MHRDWYFQHTNSYIVDVMCSSSSAGCNCCFAQVRLPCYLSYSQYLLLRLASIPSFINPALYFV